jgi:hypothetical protein
MISYFNQLRATGMPARQAALEGSVVGLRSVSMTAVLAILGVLPIALSTGIGSEVQKRLAIVVIDGGLISATVLTLFLLPGLYFLFPVDHWMKARKRRRTPVRDLRDIRNGIEASFQRTPRSSTPCGFGAEKAVIDEFGTSSQRGSSWALPLKLFLF